VDAEHGLQQVLRPWPAGRGARERYTYPRLYNLYLDPKETRSYLTHKLAYAEVLRDGMRQHLDTFRVYPPKKVLGLRA
jgi:arylsulfatase